MTINREADRARIADLFNLMGLVNIGAEIGVYHGVHAFNILSRWQGKKLVCVDSWDMIPNDPEVGRHTEKKARLYLEAFAKQGRCEIVKNFSVEAAKEFPDGSLDFVYIDAGHDYNRVMPDLKAWYPKVKVGGMFTGHDFFNQKRGPGSDVNVKQAVLKFLSSKPGTILYIAHEDHPACPDWLVEKGATEINDTILASYVDRAIGYEELCKIPPQ